MADSKQNLFESRLGRYQAAITLEQPDRIPIAPGTNYFSEKYAGYNNQEIIYDSAKWQDAEIKFVNDFPETDVLRNNRIWAPMYDAVGCKTYKLPGRDLPPTMQFQFVESDYMKADEYDLLISDPVGFMLNVYLPRVLGELSDRGSKRSYVALLKSGMAQVMMSGIMKKRSLFLESELGMPQPTVGVFLAPFDVLSDTLRGLTGIMLDLYRQPEKILEACDILTNEMINLALSTADPLKRYPIFVPTHKACFLSPKQFETYYWPSFKKTMEAIIDAGYTIRAYLEGNWSAHWHYMLEMPRGKVLCDIDSQGDIVRAKNDIGHHQCIAGGIPDSLFILGKPEEIREKVRELCSTVGKDGGYIINGGCNIPYDTKPENYRAMIDATIEFGTYFKDLKAKPRIPLVQASSTEGINKKMVTSWEEKKAELGEILGDESLIKEPWETLEVMAYNWFWHWVM